MAKDIVYSDEARSKVLLGVGVADRGGCGRPWDPGQERGDRAELGFALVTKDGVNGRQGNRIPRTGLRTWARRWCGRLHPRPAMSPGTDHHRHVLAHAIYREGVKLVTAGANPMALKRG